MPYDYGKMGGGDGVQTRTLPQTTKPVSVPGITSPTSGPLAPPAIPGSAVSGMGATATPPPGATAPGSDPAALLRATLGNNPAEWNSNTIGQSSLAAQLYGAVNQQTLAQVQQLMQQNGWTPPQAQQSAAGAPDFTLRSINNNILNPGTPNPLAPPTIPGSGGANPVGAGVGNPTAPGMPQNKPSVAPPNDIAKGGGAYAAPGGAGTPTGSPAPTSPASTAAQLASPYGTYGQITFGTEGGGGDNGPGSGPAANNNAAAWGGNLPTDAQGRQMYQLGHDNGEGLIDPNARWYDPQYGFVTDPRNVIQPRDAWDGVSNFMDRYGVTAAELFVAGGAAGLYGGAAGAGGGAGVGGSTGGLGADAFAGATATATGGTVPLTAAEIAAGAGAGATTADEALITQLHGASLTDVLNTDLGTGVGAGGGLGGAGTGPFSGATAGITGSTIADPFAGATAAATGSTGVDPFAGATAAATGGTVPAAPLLPAWAGPAASLTSGLASALHKPNATPAATNAANANQPATQFSTDTITNQGKPTPQQSTAIDSRIDEHIRHAEEAIRQNAANSGMGTNSMVVTQQIEQMRGDAEVMRVQLYQQQADSNMRNALQALGITSGTNISLANLQAQQQQQAIAQAMGIAESSAYLWQMFGE